MATASTEDAQRLLAQPLFCSECPDWMAQSGRKGKLVIIGGLTGEQGGRTRLTVELQARAGEGKRAVTYVFSVFNRTGYDVERVYQLEVTQGGKRTSSEHRRPHEHYGNARNVGSDEWCAWSFEELLRYFSSRTNIVFGPLPPDPVRFLRRK
jgi:hypothetical protein